MRLRSTSVHNFGTCVWKTAAQCQIWTSVKHTTRWYHSGTTGRSMIRWLWSILRDVVLQLHKLFRIFLIFWSKHDNAWHQHSGVRSPVGSLLVRPGNWSTDLQDLRATWLPLDDTIYFDKISMCSKSERGSLISVTYYRSKRFFWIF